MADEWKRSSIGALCDAGVAGLQTGPFGTQLHAYDYVDDGVPVVPTEAIRGRQIDHSVLPKITQTKAQELERHRLQPGDILFARRGVQATGHIGCIRQAEDGFICGTGAIRLRVARDSDEIDPDYLSHVLADPSSVEWFKFHAIGATMPNLNEGIIRSFPLSVPPLPEQCAIAHILGTLDDKIELNRRMNETLEAMARALFKSWFVDFDPVRAKAEGRAPGLRKPLADLFPDSFEDSELGEIPKGWAVGSVESLCDSITSGGTPARMNPLFWEGGSIPWFKTGELVDGPLVESEEHITRAALDGSSCKLWPAGTILFALYASPTVGRLGVLTRPGTSNQAAAGLIAKSTIGVPFLRRLLLDARGKLQAIAVGAAQQNINQAVLKAHRAVVPTEKAASEYSRLVSAADERQVALSKEAKALAALRDTLLPKLISGELRLKDAERFIGERA